jgi:hypothetical protein
MFSVDLANTIISTLLGGAIGWFIAGYYFHKPSRAEKIVDQVRFGLQKSLFPILYPDFFDPRSSIIVHPEQPAPADKDKPHVDCAFFKDGVINLNQTVEVLIKVMDLGFDLENPQGISIRDHRGNDLHVIPIGLGHVKTEFRTAFDDRLGTHRLTVTLQDTGEHRGIPNHNVQSLAFTIRQGKANEQARAA